MDKARSLYLELLRIVAAFYVFIYHFGSEPIEGKTFFVSPSFNINHSINWYAAHSFVLIFFVLSGFLITMSAHKKGITFYKFLIARLGRLYSVVIPALIFTYLVATILNHSGYKLENDDNLISRFFINLLFLTQSWSLCAMPPADGPFWSISYEFMYYLIMGTFLLFNKAYKVILLIVFMLLAGPKVLLLFPVWLAGSLLYSLSKRKHFFSSLLSFMVFVITFIVMVKVIIKPFNFPLLKQIGDNQILKYNLFFSWNYQADYLLTILIVLNMYSFFGFSHQLNKYLDNFFLRKISDIIYKIGNCTFTLYLFHVPLMFLIAVALPYNQMNPWHNVFLLCSTLISVYFIARITEWRVLYWRNLIEKLFNFLLENRMVKKIKSIAS